MAFVHAACSKSVRDERVESQQEAHSEDADRHEERTADANRANRLGTNPPDHHRVDDTHRHPAEFSHHDWHSQRKHRTKFLAEVANPGGSYLRRRCVAFHFSTTRRSSFSGSSLSSTCRRRTTSLFSQTPPFFFTMIIAADCIPRLSPPAAWPPSRAAISRIDK